MLIALILTERKKLVAAYSKFIMMIFLLIIPKLTAFLQF